MDPYAFMLLMPPQYTPTSRTHESQYYLPPGTGRRYLKKQAQKAYDSVDEYISGQRERHKAHRRRHKEQTQRRREARSTISRITESHREPSLPTRDENLSVEYTYPGDTVASMDVLVRQKKRQRLVRCFERFLFLKAPLLLNAIRRRKGKGFKLPTRKPKVPKEEPVREERPEPLNPDPLNVEQERNQVSETAHTEQWVAEHSDHLRALESSLLELENRIQNGEMQIKQNKEVRDLLKKHYEEKKRLQKERDKLIKQHKKHYDFSSVKEHLHIRGHSRENSKEVPSIRVTAPTATPDPVQPSTATSTSTLSSTKAQTVQAPIVTVVEATETSPTVVEVITEPIEHPASSSTTVQAVVTTPEGQQTTVEVVSPDETREVIVRTAEEVPLQPAPDPEPSPVVEVIMREDALPAVVIHEEAIATTDGSSEALDGQDEALSSPSPKVRAGPGGWPGDGAADAGAVIAGRIGAAVEIADHDLPFLVPWRRNYSGLLMELQRNPAGSLRVIEENRVGRNVHFDSPWFGEGK